jgi:hypothetical protein
MWEDAQNLDGGRWVLNLDKKYHNNSLDIYWLNTLLALIGDQFLDESAYVNGVWVNVRGKADKIALWTKSAKNADVQLKIGHRLKEILALKDKDLVLTYEVSVTSFLWLGFLFQNIHFYFYSTKRNIKLQIQAQSRPIYINAKLFLK